MVFITHIFTSKHIIDSNLLVVDNFSKKKYLIFLFLSYVYMYMCVCVFFIGMLFLLIIKSHLTITWRERSLYKPDEEESDIVKMRT